MRAYLFDTNVVSTLRRPDRIPYRVVSALDDLPPELCFVSVITMMEIEHGIRLCERRDRRQGAILRNWFTAYRKALGDDLVLPVTEAIALACAAIGVPNPQPHNDALIAATALVHGLTLVTRNVADFAGIEGCRILDPWAA